MKRWYDIRNAAGSEDLTGEATILIYDDIGFGGVGAEQFIRELDGITAPVINVRVNSYGGETFDGFAMFNALRRHPSRIVSHIDGIAASAASYAAVSGAEVRIARNGQLMIHNPISMAIGSAADMRSEAEMLDRMRLAIANLYVERTGKPLDQVIAWMDATTWFDAEEAVAAGFVDTITDDVADPARVSNRRKPVLNYSAGRVPDADRLKSLGIADALKPPANAGEKGPNMGKAKNAEGDAPAAVWPDPADVREGITFGPTGAEYKGTLVVPMEADIANAAAPTNRRPVSATAAELKAAFPDDRDFVIERLDTNAPMGDHKAAYADRVIAINKRLTSELATLRSGQTTAAANAAAVADQPNGRAAVATNAAAAQASANPAADTGKDEAIERAKRRNAKK